LLSQERLAERSGLSVRTIRDLESGRVRRPRTASVRLLAATAPGGTPAVVVVVAGTAGVGKTALAVHAAHQLRSWFPDGQLYANLGGAGPRPQDPGEVLSGLLRVLGVDGAAIPAAVGERAAL
jgi:transcriptional regulator with XRE-family HTH domain